MTSVGRQSRFALLGSVGIGALALMLVLSGNFDVGLLLLPTLALFALLLLGHAPGEDLITRLRERFSARPRRRAPERSAVRPSYRSRIAGGRLLAQRLAGRAPPLAARLTASALT